MNNSTVFVKGIIYQKRTNVVDVNMNLYKWYSTIKNKIFLQNMINLYIKM